MQTPTIRRVIFSTLSFCLISQIGSTQILTAEDSLNAGLSKQNQATYISGYGEVVATADFREQTGVVDLRRNVLFIGHKFNNNIQFFSELEIEHAVVKGGAEGELAMEQLFVKFNLNRNNYLVGGLFIPRIGIINENHLPTTFNSNDRHHVERQIIPSTWRELGIGFYSNVSKKPGLNLSVAIMNGLNSADFTNGSGIRSGRYAGSKASASNLAATGAALYYYKNWRIQASAYYGGSVGLSPKDADTLNLKHFQFEW